MKLLLAIGLALYSAAAQEPYRDTGPLSLIITYRCDPAQRANLRAAMVNGGVSRFEGWKTKGVLKDYRILFNRYVDSETWDMVAFLEFARYADVARWQDVEREYPGGLGDESRRYVTFAVTTPTDTVRSKSAATLPGRGRGVYFLIPYDYLIPTDEYIRYLDGYVIPQMNGWLGEEVLSAYTLCIGRYATSRPWSALFMLEYRDQEAFGKREATVAKVREKLKNDPSWKAFSENKQKVRVEKQTIIAEELVAK